MTPDVPTISVVTVTLNCRSDAIETARSVWMQNCKDFEYIVKDGGSTDGTTEGIAGEKQPVNITISKDKGIYDAMGQAVKLCRGKYVLFLNAGDLFRTPDSIGSVVRTIQSAGEPEVVYTYNANILRKTIVKYPSTLGRFYLFRRSVNHQATYIRRDCYERYGGFDPGFPVLADNELLARLILKHGCRSVLCPVVSVDYKDGGSSVSPKNRIRAAEERKRIQALYFTRGERSAFSLLHAMMLPGLRGRMLHSFPSSPLTRVYYRLANAFNGSIGRH